MSDPDLAAERERQTQARIDEVQAEIDRLQALNEVDRVRLREIERSRRAETPRWFDHWEDGASREHRGDQDDAEAEQRQREQWGG